MSSTILKLIPTDPDFVPNEQNQIKAKAFLKNVFKHSDIEFNTTENVEFVDPGANFETVNCNLCGHTIDIQAWQNAMDKAYNTKFKVLTFITPCCQKTTSLNDLKYHWAAGFAKFEISILDPSSEIKTDDLTELNKILTTKINVIWAHY